MLASDVIFSAAVADIGVDVSVKFGNYSSNRDLSFLIWSFCLVLQAACNVRPLQRIRCFA